MRNILLINSFLFFLLLISCSTNYQWQATATLIPINAKQDHLSNKGMEQVIAPYKAQLDKEMNTVIGYADVTLDVHTPESLLSNFTADALLKTANEVTKKEKVDMSVVNVGGLRKSIAKGNITYRTIYEVMPFENELVIVTLSGTDVNKLLQQIAAKGGEGIGGAKMLIENGQASNISIGGNPINFNKTYRIATSDYLSAGNDGMIAFRKAQQQENTYLKIRDVLIDYIKNETLHGKPIQSTLDQRIYVK